MTGGYGFSRLGMENMRYNRNLRKGRKMLKDSHYHGETQIKNKGNADFDEIDSLRKRIEKKRSKQNIIVWSSIVLIVIISIIIFF